MMIWAIHPVVIILFVVFAMIPMIIEFVKDIIPNSCQMGGILGLILGFVANVSVKYNKYISTHVTLSLIIGFLVMTLVSLLRLWPAGLWQSHSLNINQVITISVALFTTAIVMIGGLAIVISYVEKKKAVNSLLELKNQSIIGQGGNDQD
jgi:CDP-diglyceride synthetase